MKRSRAMSSYINKLTSGICGGCGANKKRGMAFCYKCFKQLPISARKALYRYVGQGFEGAYDDALSLLRSAI